MPVGWGVDAPCYEPSVMASCCDYSIALESDLLAMRKEYAGLWQEFKMALKDAKRSGDAYLIEIMKERESYNRKMYRAMTYIIPHFIADGFPGDCRKEDVRKWPLDCVNELDHVFAVLRTRGH